MQGVWGTFTLDHRIFNSRNLSQIIFYFLVYKSIKNQLSLWSTVRFLEALLFLITVPSTKKIKYICTIFLFALSIKKCIYFLCLKVYAFVIMFVLASKRVTPLRGWFLLWRKGIKGGSRWASPLEGFPEKSVSVKVTA